MKLWGFKGIVPVIGVRLSLYTLDPFDRRQFGFADGCQQLIEHREDTVLSFVSFPQASSDVADEFGGHH